MISPQNSMIECLFEESVVNTLCTVGDGEDTNIGEETHSKSNQKVNSFLSYFRTGIDVMIVYLTMTDSLLNVSGRQTLKCLRTQRIP